MPFDFDGANNKIWTGGLLDEADRMHTTTAVFIGQPQVRQQIEPFLRADQFPHSLITGEPGIGKTNLARWIASQTGDFYTEAICPVRPGDIPAFGIILLDEIHNLGAKPEWLYPTLDNVTVTILGATTRPELLDPALVSRFMLRIQMRRYDIESMRQILVGFAPNLGRHSDTPEDWVTALAGAGAGNPRQLQRIVAVAEGCKTFDPAIVLPAAQITADGLTTLHLDYLAALDTIKRPAGIELVASMMYIDPGTVKGAERLLIEYGLVELTPNGRKLSSKGARYVNLLHAKESETQ